MSPVDSFSEYERPIISARTPARPDALHLYRADVRSGRGYLQARVVAANRRRCSPTGRQRWARLTAGGDPSLHYLAMIALARRHIYLQSPFLIVDTSVAEAMKTGPLSGLDVRVMIAPSGAELSPAYRAGLTYAAEMARAGVRVFPYRGEYFPPRVEK